MILSNTEIHKALDDGHLIISPEPSPRFPEEGCDCPYQTSAVDLRLGHQVLIPRGNRPFNIDLRKGKFASLATAENYDSIELRANQPYSLASQTFVLAKTLELVELPIRNGGPFYAARVEGRSSLARCGMLVHFTAPTIHSGFRGTITLEIINLAPTTIALYPEARVCQLIIEEVRGKPFRNESQFHAQTDPAGRR